MTKNKIITHTELQMWKRGERRWAKNRRPVQKVRMTIEKNGELHHVCCYKAAARILGASTVSVYLQLRNGNNAECYLNNCKVLVG